MHNYVAEDFKGHWKNVPNVFLGGSALRSTLNPSLAAHIANIAGINHREFDAFKLVMLEGGYVGRVARQSPR